MLASFVVGVSIVEGIGVIAQIGIGFGNNWKSQYLGLGRNQIWGWAVGPVSR